MLDGKDFHILEALKENSRKSIKEIAKETGIPRTTVFDRIKKLRKEKVIKKFTLIPDYERLGLEAMAFILIEFNPVKGVSQRNVAKEIAKLKGVLEVHLISGEWDILVKARAKSMHEIGSLIIDKMRTIKGVASTITCACFDTIKEEV
jgi:DNA-binding Lrp family transcriptional regulator